MDHLVLLRRVLSGDKTFSGFQKDGLPFLKRKVQTPFPNTIKWKDVKWTPLGSTLAESLRAIKHFQDFKKADYRQ